MKEFCLRSMVLATAVLVIGSVISASAAFASELSGNKFLGFWEGIDPGDGSVVQVSISDIENDGLLEIVAREGFFTVCFSSENTMGRGVVIGIGTVINKSELEVVRDRTCINDDNTTEVPVNSTVYYTLKSNWRILDIGFAKLHRINK